jgi:hypothetical protein
MVKYQSATEEIRPRARWLPAACNIMAQAAGLDGQ